MPGMYFIQGLFLLLFLGQTHKNEWQQQTLDCITNILVWTPQPSSLSSKQQTHARTHPPMHTHTSASCQNIFFLTVKTDRMENLTGCMSHKQLQTYPSNMLAVVRVFILVWSQAKTSQGACHTSHCIPTHQTCWVLFVCCSFWFGLKLPRILNQWLLMNSNWGHYMQFSFIVPSYSDSKTNTPVLKYTVTMFMVVMTVKLIPLYQNVQSQHPWL